MIAPIVVTGASGYLGLAVTTILQRRGHDVIAVCRQGPPPADCEVAIVENYDETPAPAGAALVHLAETASLTEAEQIGEPLVAHNRKVALALAAKGFERIVYASSGVVYGDRVTLPRHPDDPTANGNVYARAKLAAERVFLSVGGAVARLSNIYGPNPARGTVMRDILECLDSEGPVRIGNGMAVRDFLWRDDAAAGFVDLLAVGEPGIYHLSTGIGTRVRELAEKVLACTGQAWRGVLEDKAASRMSSLVLDSTATTQACGWQPVVSLDDGLAAMIGNRS